MFIETIEADKSVLMGSTGYINDPVYSDRVTGSEGIERLEAITDPVDKGAEKIINFVDKVTSIPQRLEGTARDINDYLISVGERISGESEARARENLGAFKIGDTIQRTAESGLKWAKNNYLILIAVFAVWFFIFKK